MLNSKVLMSSADYFSVESPINPYYHTEHVDIDAAIRDHALVTKSLQQAGIETIMVDAPFGCQDGVYSANWALVRGSKAVMARLPNARKLEEEFAKKTLENLGIICYTLPEDLKFSGQGDSLPLHSSTGDYLLGGKTYRSDHEAQRFAAKTLGYELVQLETIPKQNVDGSPHINEASGWPDSYFYDIDLALSIISGDLIAYCPAAFTKESREKIEALPVEKIEVSYDEATLGFACNLVSTGETVVMSNAAPLLQSELEKRGYKTITPNITELKKGGGFIRCVSLTIN